MKKLLWLSLVLPVGLLAAFQLPKNNIRQMSTNLYTATSVSRLTTTADQEVVRKAIIDYYKLKDVRAGQISISQNDPRNKAGWIFSDNAFTSFISTHFISWKGKGSLPQEALRVQKVLNKYAVRQ
ncbi:MAG: hypothetical protein ACRYFZ_11290 [Janthinobacterium lividum]